MAQLTPTGEWRVWTILAGRGWGKTRTGAEDIAHYALWNDGVRVAVIAPTFADARDICVEGTSGLLRVIPEECVVQWSRTHGEMVLFNDSRIKIFSADQPDRLRGPQHHRVWCDELAAWGKRDAFDQMMFGLRLGDDPRVIVTTTPRPVELVMELVGRSDVYLTRGSTFDNAANLPPAALRQLTERYAGTRLGRQELEAELLTEIEGALWRREQIEALRVAAAPEMARVVVAIDPAVTHGPDSDETGIVAVGRGVDGLFYVLADGSGRLAVEMWAARAVALFEKVEGHVMVAEVNEGGDMVGQVLRHIAPDLPFRSVRAVRGKVERALPVAALYEQGRVRHVAGLTGLEDQMVRFTYDGFSGGSPDRVDALVWAVTELSAGIGVVPRVRRV